MKAENLFNWPLFCGHHRWGRSP